MSETVAYVNRARAFMPPGTVPPFVMRFDAGSVPVGDLVFSSASAHGGRDAGPGAEPRASAVRDAAGRVGAAALRRQRAQHRRQREARPACAPYNMSPDEIVAAMTRGQHHQPVRATCPSAASIPMVPLNSVVKNIKDLESVPIRTGRLSDGVRARRRRRWWTARTS